MTKKYDHRQIESKWQKHWQERKSFKTEADPSKPKYYVLDMFPYPSGSGLHVGHVVGYTATDIVARHKRQKGFNVLHPMGWDSFGLPAEQYAVRTGTHPAVTTKQNIDNFRRQLRSLGFSYDWDREFATSDPSYYKWTQWIFTKLYERGLAYEAEMLVNYCPVSWHSVGQRRSGKWPFQRGWASRGTPPFAPMGPQDHGLRGPASEDLDLLDWPESLKKLQSNWIGKSEGAQVEFPVKGITENFRSLRPAPILFWRDLHGAGPEHPLVDAITTAEQREAVGSYRKQAATKSDLDRTELSKAKTGVFTGGLCDQSCERQGHPDLDCRLCPHGLWNGRHHGGSRS